jgi:hypothetical protein
MLRLDTAGEELISAAMDLYDAVMEMEQSITGLYPDCVRIHSNRMATALANYLRAIHAATYKQ